MLSISLAAAILAIFGVIPGTRSDDRRDAPVANGDIISAAKPSGPNGQGNVRFGLPRVPRPRVPGW